MYSYHNAKIKNIMIIGLPILLAVVVFEIYSIWYDKEKNYILIWWTPFGTNENFISCYNKYNCFVTSNRKFEYDAVLFYGTHFRAENIPLPKNDTPWAIFHEESPRNLALFLHDQTHLLFDITATFSRYSDFPLTLQYLENVDNLTDTTYFVQVENKQKSVVYIQSNCDTPNDRDGYVKELMKYLKIDSYGTCLKNKEFPERLSQIHPLDFFNEEMLYYLGEYKFTIAFENAICDDYITEKLWRPLVVGSVPIYLGSPSIEDWLPNKNSAILAKNFETPKDLAEFIIKLDNNNTLYNSFLEHKLNSTITNHLLKKTLAKGSYGITTDNKYSIEAFECFICKEISEKRTFLIKNTTESIYNCLQPEERSWMTHWTYGRCQAKALAYFVDQGKNFSEQAFNQKWLDYHKKNKC